MAGGRGSTPHPRPDRQRLSEPMISLVVAIERMDGEGSTWRMLRQSRPSSGVPQPRRLIDRVECAGDGLVSVETLTLMT